MTEKQFNSVYIGVVGPEIVPYESTVSIEGLRTRDADVGPIFSSATKGYEARQQHLENWFNETEHDGLLLLDHDMVFAPDTLERLRAHGKSFVSGYYMRRRFSPIAPVWFAFSEKNELPFIPWTKEPERGRLHPLGASGWGCALLHRNVIKSLKPILKGEDEIIEDDMDIWPYDLKAIMGALRVLRTLTTEYSRIMDDRRQRMLLYANTILQNEIRILTGMKSIVTGSDVRFGFYARAAGHILFGDPDVRPKHFLNFPLSPDLYSADPDERQRAEADWGPSVKTYQDAMDAARKWVQS